MGELYEFLSTAQRRALHLEMRDGYMRSEPRFQTWLAGQPLEHVNPYGWWELIAPMVARGVDLRRLRVFSEPISDYIRYEHELSEWNNIAHGERIRWLPRQLASDLKFPGNDHWIVDDATMFLHFQGDGELIGYERRDEPEVVTFCLESFEAAWVRGVDHSDYQPK